MRKKVFGIVVALEKETAELLKLLNVKKQFILASKKVFKAEFNKSTIYLIISGIGKVNSSLCTQLLIDKFNVSAVINFGNCGGLEPNVKVKSLYRIDSCFQYDFDLSYLDKVPVGYIQDYGTKFFPVSTDKLNGLELKRLATSDRFTYKTEDVDVIKENECDIFDMEGGAIAEVCMANNVPLYIIKGVSDTYGSEQVNQYEENAQCLREAFPDQIFNLLTELING
ncbi:MAG: 5'-methylthioadenosine/S-adenosylhomocysteine nucleosidase [Clostridia bacterium]|nr:5'-methylthioadenosine/S-adenosylhomocysteine nucleosidase [Clostridia bacterium]